MCSVADGDLCRVCAFVGRANVNKIESVSLAILLNSSSEQVNTEMDGSY